METIPTIEIHLPPDHLGSIEVRSETPVIVKLRGPVSYRRIGTKGPVTIDVHDAVIDTFEGDRGISLVSQYTPRIHGISPMHDPSSASAAWRPRMTGGLTDLSAFTR